MNRRVHIEHVTAPMPLKAAIFTSFRRVVLETAIRGEDAYRSKKKQMRRKGGSLHMGVVSKIYPLAPPSPHLPTLLGIPPLLSAMLYDVQSSATVRRNERSSISLSQVEQDAWARIHHIYIYLGDSS